MSTAAQIKTAIRKSREQLDQELRSAALPMVTDLEGQEILVYARPLTLRTQRAIQQEIARQPGAFTVVANMWIASCQHCLLGANGQRLFQSFTETVDHLGHLPEKLLIDLLEELNLGEVRLINQDNAGENLDVDPDGDEKN